MINAKPPTLVVQKLLILAHPQKFCREKVFLMVVHVQSSVQTSVELH